MKNAFEIRGEDTVIFLRRKDGTILETLIDSKNLQRVQEFKLTWYAWYSGKGNYYVLVMCN